MWVKTRSKYPDFVKFVEDFDILCLSETKVDKYDIFDLPNYTYLSKPRSARYKRKSGGIGFFVHNSLMKNIQILDSDCEYIFWIKINNFMHNEDFVIGSMYVPPKQSKFYSDEEFFKFENDVSIKRCSYENIMLTGDSNAHTSNLPDYLEEDIFLSRTLDLDDDSWNIPNNYGKLSQYNIPITRSFKCNKIDHIGYKFLDICKNNNLFIANGRIGNDKSSGNFTFRGTTVIDYTICSPNILRLMNNFEVMDLDPIFSDGHSLLYMTIHAPSPILVNVNVPQSPLHVTSRLNGKKTINMNSYTT